MSTGCPGLCCHISCETPFFLGPCTHYALYILSIILGEVAPGSRAKDAKKSYPTCQRAAVMSDTSSGSEEDETGKAKCRDEKAADFSGGGRGEYAVKCPHAHILNPFNFLGETAPGSRAKDVQKSYPTRQRATAMSNTSSGSKEDGNGKARCRDETAADFSGGGGMVML